MADDGASRELLFDTLTLGRVGRLSDQQAEFYANRSSRTLLFEGGVGSGKTTAGAAAVLDRSLLNGPAVTTMVAAQTYRQLRDPVIKQIELLCDGFGISHSLNQSTMVMSVYPEQVPIAFVSTEREENLKGPNVGVMWMDEAASHSPLAFEILSQRVRDPRAKIEQKLLTTTPEGEETWVEELKANAGKADSGIALFNAPTTSNLALSKEFIADMLLIYKDDPDGYQQYMLGIAKSMKGSIYHITDKNVRKFDRSQLKHAEIVVGQDYNARWMVSVIAAWFSTYNILHVFGEVVSKNPGGISTEDHAKRVVQWLGDQNLLHDMGRRPRGGLMDKWMRPIVAFTDASGDSIHSNHYMTDDAAMLNAGFVVRHEGANPPVRSRIAAMNRAYALGRQLIDKEGAPETYRAVCVHSRNKKGEPNKDWRPKEFQADHYCDACGYMNWGVLPFHTDTIGVVHFQ